MEEFLFVAPDGEIYREELDGQKVRHGDIGKKYMELKNLSMIDVDSDTKNGFYWGKELAKNHSTLVIQNAGKSGAVYIPSELTESQKIWIEKYLLIEIEIFNGLLLVCDFIGDNIEAYNSNNCDVIGELEKCLNNKGVNISIYKEEDVNGLGNKRRYT